MSLITRLMILTCGAVFAAVLAFRGPGQMMLAITGVFMALMVLRQPLSGLVMFALLATLIPYATVQLGVRITLSEAMLAFTWAGVSWHLFLGKMRMRWGRTEQRVAWLILFSALPFVVGQVVVKAGGSGLVNWLRWLLNVSPVFLMPILLEEEASQDGLIVAMLLGTLGMLLLSLGFFIKDRQAISFLPVLESLRYAHPEAARDIFSANPTRMASPWVHPNLTGGALAIFLPLAFLYARTVCGWRRWLGIAVTLLGAVGLLLSLSRGAIVSLVLVMVWLSWRRLPFAGRILALGTVLGTAVVTAYPPLQERLATAFSSSNASTGIRLDEYRRFPEALVRYPLGIGFKTDPPPPETGLLGISNLWLNYAYKLGIPGLILFIGVVAAWWREAGPRGRFDRLHGHRALAVGTSTGVLAALLTGFFDHYCSFTVVLTALFWTMMGLSLRLSRTESPQPLPEQ